MKRLFAVFTVFALFSLTAFSVESDSLKAQAQIVQQEEDEMDAEVAAFENASEEEAKDIDDLNWGDLKKMNPAELKRLVEDNELDIELGTFDKKAELMKAIAKELEIGKPKPKVFGIRLINNSDFYELVTRFLFNMIFVLLVVRFLYYSISKRKDYLFTYILISVIVFLLCFLLGNVKIQLGFALGLFAIFGIIRYRTMQMPIKEMTYLFIVIGLSVVNALANKKVSYAELMFTNLAIFGVTYLLEKVWLLRHESHKVIRYDNIELIKPECYDDLKADLEERTGLSINRIEVGSVNFLTDSAKIQIFYYEQDNGVNDLAENPFTGSDV